MNERVSTSDYRERQKYLRMVRGLSAAVLGLNALYNTGLLVPAKTDNRDPAPHARSSLVRDTPLAIGVVSDSQSTGLNGIYNEVVLAKAVSDADKQSRFASDNIYGMHIESIVPIDAQPDAYDDDKKPCYRENAVEQMESAMREQHKIGEVATSIIAINEHMLCGNFAGKAYSNAAKPYVVLNKQRSTTGLDGLMLHELGHLRGAHHSTLLSENKDYANPLKPLKDLYPREAKDMSIQSMLSQGFTAFKQENSNNFSAYSDPTTVMGAGIPSAKDVPVYSAVNLNEIDSEVFKLANVDYNDSYYSVGYGDKRPRGITFALSADHAIKQIDPSIDKLSVVLKPIYSNKPSQFYRDQPFTYDAMIYFRGQHQNYGYGVAVPISEQSRPTMKETTVFIDDQIKGGVEVRVGKDLMRGLYMHVTPIKG